MSIGRIFHPCFDNGVLTLYGFLGWKKFVDFLDGKNLWGGHSVVILNGTSGAYFECRKSV
jgi:hypothetical protein